MFWDPAFAKLSAKVAFTRMLLIADKRIELNSLIDNLHCRAEHSLMDAMHASMHGEIGRQHRPQGIQSGENIFSVFSAYVEHSTVLRRSECSRCCESDGLHGAASGRGESADKSLD